MAINMLDIFERAADEFYGTHTKEFLVRLPYDSKALIDIQLKHLYQNVYNLGRECFFISHTKIRIDDRTFYLIYDITKKDDLISLQPLGNHIYFTHEIMS